MWVLTACMTPTLRDTVLKSQTSVCTSELGAHQRSIQHLDTCSVDPSCLLPFFFSYTTVTSCFTHHLFFFCCYFCCFFFKQHTGDLKGQTTYAHKIKERDSKKYPWQRLPWGPLSNHIAKDDIKGPSPFCWTSDKGSTSL